MKTEIYYSDFPEFREFVNGEFDKVAVGATVEELADFAFGSMEEAIGAFKEEQKKNSSGK